MNHPLRGPVLAILALVVVFAAPLSANASDTSRERPSSDRNQPRFTRSEAEGVLSRARSMMRRHTDRPTTRQTSGDLTMRLRDLFLARPYLAGADRRTADRILSRDTAAAKVETSAVRANPTVACSTHFCVHYGSTTTSSWARTTLDTLEHVWDVEVPYMDRAPLPDGGDPSDPGNPDDRLDVFLQNLAPQGVYGACTGEGTSSQSQVSAYCVLDDNYKRSEYGADPLDSLRVTAAHEFFHAIQFSMDISESLWFMEGTAVWMEDHVYDSINDNYQYLPTSPIRHPRTSLDSSSSTYPYGSFIFFTYASERQDAAIVRRFWDAAVGSSTALRAIYTVVGSSQWPTFFATFGSWNTLPAGSYSERRGYPSPVFGRTQTLTTKAPSTGWRTVGIPRLASSTVLLRPGSTLSTRKRLMVQVDGANLTSGTAALLQRRYRDGRVTHTMIKLDANGNGHTLVRLNRTVLRAVVVVLSNTSRSGGRHGFRVRAGLR